MSPAQLSIESTLGALFVGFAFACGAYGILASQVFSYFWHYPSDGLFLKLVVSSILLLATADQAFIGHLVYYYSVKNYGDYEVVRQAATTWSFILQLTVGSIIGTIVKTAFGIRVWKFSERNYYITGLIMLLTFGQLCVATVFAIKAFQLPSVFAVHQIHVLGTVSLTTGVFTDVITALALCYFLSRLRTGISSSDSIVNSLCRYAINTGAVTSAVSLTTLILFNVNSQTSLSFAATYFILSKLYAISYMGTLNTRRKIKGRGTDKQGATLTTDSTNLFHLGTRVPTIGGLDSPAMEHGTRKLQPADDFPYNSFAQPSLPPRAI
jgi:hypothetical protein